MASTLPGWAVDPAGSIELEIDGYRDMPDEERFRIMSALSRASARLMEARDDGFDVLEHIDPLPDSSRRILARLRESARRGGVEPGGEDG